MSNNLQLLVTGHPRCGSKFSAHYITLLGLQTSHELPPKPKHHGLCSWAYTIKHTKGDKITPRYGYGGDGWRKMYTFENTIVHIRNPFDSFDAIINENQFKWSYNIRCKYIKNKLGKSVTGSELECAILCYLYWYEILLDECEFYFRIEYDLDKLKSYIAEKFIEPNDLTGQTINKVNSKTKIRTITKDSFKSVNSEIMQQLNDFCVKVGYPTYEEHFR
tara:strand:- start:496 stop:1152 length:657 start_codon:yes stop_codon:yes gene_type:complete